MSSRKRKADLAAPQCSPDCQINHTIEQTAALLHCSADTVRNMIDAGALPHITLPTGGQKKMRRIPHPVIRALHAPG